MVRVHDLSPVSFHPLKRAFDGRTRTQSLPAALDVQKHEIGRQRRCSDYEGKRDLCSSRIYRVEPTPLTYYVPQLRGITISGQSNAREVSPLQKGWIQGARSSSKEPRGFVLQFGISNSLFHRLALRREPSWQCAQQLDRRAIQPAHLTRQTDTFSKYWGSYHDLTATAPLDRKTHVLSWASLLP